jgi:hypothetical protein
VGTRGPVLARSGLILVRRERVDGGSKLYKGCKKEIKKGDALHRSA